jgi:hypothetical protein
MSEVIRQLAKPIRAYHGSPYDFDRFDSSKIGTGEGAQAYGYGLYFAGNEDVGKGYRDRLSPKRDLFVGGEPIPVQLPSDDSPRVRALKAIRQASHGDVEPMEALRDAYTISLDTRDKDYAARVTEALNDIKSRGLSFGPQKGHMYEVDISHPEGAMLNYDKPFDDDVGARAAAVLRDRNPAAINRQTLQDIESGQWRFIVPNQRYGSPYQRAAFSLAEMARSRSGAKALQEAGIPGVRYLDDGSRHGGGPVTRNYVVFPGAEDGIRILRKYGVMAPVAAGAASQQEQQK